MNSIKPAFSLTTSSPEHSRLKAHCPRCNAASSFAPVGPATHSDQSNLWTFSLGCLHCGGRVLMDYDAIQRAVTNLWPATVRTWPRPEYWDAIHAPVRLALLEVYRANGAGAFTLVGIGCRVVLERLVQGKGYRDGSGLASRLERLRESYPELVPALSMADVLKLVGDSAAHVDFADLNAEQADALIEFTEHVLEAVYVAPERRKRMEAAFRQTPGC